MSRQRGIASKCAWLISLAGLLCLFPLAVLARAATLSIAVPASVAPGSNYRVTITGGFAPTDVSASGAYLVSLIQYSGERCASTATIEAQEGLPISFYLAPPGTRLAGITETLSPFSRSDTLTATTPGARRVCAYLYPQQIGSGDTFAPTATADAAFTVLPGGGHGQLATDGRVGRLRLDSSSLADVVAFAGPSEAQAFGELLAPTLPGYHALGYGCERGSTPADDLFAIAPRGPECRTVFFINDRTAKLVALFTSSPGYTGPHRIHPGMPAAEAERRAHVHATSGCLVNFGFGSRRTRAVLIVNVLGGREITHHHRGGPPVGRVIGGRLGGFSLESTRHPIGLLEC
jgi:hypothetical protein